MGTIVGGGATIGGTLGGGYPRGKTLECPNLCKHKYMYSNILHCMLCILE